jgi:hypothetical protein
MRVNDFILELPLVYLMNVQVIGKKCVKNKEVIICLLATRLL